MRRGTRRKDRKKSKKRGEADEKCTIMDNKE
jgi:hypothetical protein